LQGHTKATAAAPAAAIDAVPLVDLDAESVGHLLTTMSKQLSKYREAFTACEIDGMQLEGLKERAQLKELGIDMPDLVFGALIRRIDNVTTVLSGSSSFR